MLHQYFQWKKVKKLALGEIIYIQDGVRPMNGFRGDVVRKNPWIIQGFLNREYAVVGGKNTYLHGGHLVQVKSLRDGRVKNVSDWICKASQEVCGDV